jgi:hypothetical protein
MKLKFVLQPSPQQDFLMRREGREEGVLRPKKNGVIFNHAFVTD